MPWRWARYPLPLPLSEVADLFLQVDFSEKVKGILYPGSAHASESASLDRVPESLR
jgi:hypothetical protein